MTWTSPKSLSWPSHRGNHGSNQVHLPPLLILIPSLYLYHVPPSSFQHTQMNCAKVVFSPAILLIAITCLKSLLYHVPCYRTNLCAFKVRHNLVPLRVKYIFRGFFPILPFPDLYLPWKPSPINWHVSASGLSHVWYFSSSYFKYCAQFSQEVAFWWFQHTSLSFSSV